MGLIDADALSKLVGEPIEVFLRRLDLKLPPTVDAVPVVRCNDCKYLGILNEKRIYAICNKHGKVFYLWGEDAREHFCSWGERKDEVTDGSSDN